MMLACLHCANEPPDIQKKLKQTNSNRPQTYNTHLKQFAPDVPKPSGQDVVFVTFASQSGLHYELAEHVLHGTRDSTPQLMDEAKLLMDSMKAQSFNASALAQIEGGSGEGGPAALQQAAAGPGAQPSGGEGLQMQEGGGGGGGAGSVSGRLGSSSSQREGGGPPALTGPESQHERVSGSTQSQHGTEHER